MLRKWDVIREAVNRIDTHYATIALPHKRGETLIDHLPGNAVEFKTLDGQRQTTTLTPPGVNYLLYRLHAYDKKSYIDRDKARETLKQGRMRDFCKLINRATRYMLTSNFKEAKRDYWVTASNKYGGLRGVMTSYNPFSHAQVLQTVEDAKLDAMVRWATVSDIELKLFLCLESLGDTNAEFGMMITNGETGHVSLGYHAAIRVDNYIFSWKLATVRRHLSRLDEAEQELKTALNACRNIAIRNVIKNVKVSRLALSSKDDRLQDEIDRLKEKPIGKLIAGVAYVRGLKGHKTEAEKLLTRIFKGIEGELTK